MLFYLNENIMVLIFSSISSFSHPLRLGSEKKCVACVGVSSESLLLTSFQMEGKSRRRAKNRRKWGGKFSYYISLFHFPFIFFWIFFLWWWYGKLRGRLRLFGSFFHIILVSIYKNVLKEWAGRVAMAF